MTAMVQLVEKEPVHPIGWRRELDNHHLITTRVMGKPQKQACRQVLPTPVASRNVVAKAIGQSDGQTFMVETHHHCLLPDPPRT